MNFSCFMAFVRGGPTLTTHFLVDEGLGGSKYHYKRVIIGPSAKRLMAFRWRTDDGPTLNAGLVAS